MRSIEVVDSHTAGEPTRVIVDGMPSLGLGTLAERRARFRDEFDSYRTAVVGEPRGSDVLVGALVCEPEQAASAAGVIFFNNVGYLGMCGHGLIGVVTTLAWLGRIGVGRHAIDTPVGTVYAELHADGQVAFENVASYRHAKDVTIGLPSGEQVTGDVAWGGNWFYLVHDLRSPPTLAEAPALAQRAMAIRAAINAAGYSEIDHIELIGSPGAGGHARNFVLCPGGAFDRSPCGTGTSAALAALAADGKLKPGETWVQEGVLGTQFVGSYRWHDRERGTVVPTIRGAAYVNGRGTLLFDERDPFRWGIPAPRGGHA